MRAMRELRERRERIVHAIEWKFTRFDLNTLLAGMRSRYTESRPLKVAAWNYAFELLKWTAKGADRRCRVPWC